MRITALVSSLFLITACLVVPHAVAQEYTADHTIAAAVSAAPLDLREGATVVGYTDEGTLTTLREGTNELICMADEPGDERFHVACYHESLEPFMARGRALRAEGRSRDELMSIREEEINAGTLTMPSHPASLYSYTGPLDSFDPETGELSGGSRLYVVYIAYATPEQTGLSPTPVPGQPWIMNPGKPWAHIMLMPKE